jgi:hypothetical protein
LLNLFVVVVLILSLVLLAAREAQALSPDIVVSQVYGGGGNSGAPHRKISSLDLILQSIQDLPGNGQKPVRGRKIK